MNNTTTEPNDEIDKLLSSVWSDGYQCWESGVVWGTEYFKLKSVDEAREAIQRLVVEAKLKTIAEVRYIWHSTDDTDFADAMNNMSEELQASLNTKQEGK